MSNYAFIDSQNLYLGIKSQEWEIDYAKLRLYLKNKFNIEKAFIFIGYVPKNIQLYTNLQKAGYIVVFKPTISYIAGSKRTQKGNVDAELVLHAAAIEYGNYEQAIIISSDGDFACLAEYLAGNNKLLKIMTPSQKYSKLLSKFGNRILQINDCRKSLEKDPEVEAVEGMGEGVGLKAEVTLEKKPQQDLKEWLEKTLKRKTQQRLKKWLEKTLEKKSKMIRSVVLREQKNNFDI